MKKKCEIKKIQDIRQIKERREIKGNKVKGNKKMSLGGSPPWAVNSPGGVNYLPGRLPPREGQFPLLK